jgi:histidinol phosphatase-like enzyme (inositol monophosphatase family)
MTGTARRCEYLDFAIELAWTAGQQVLSRFQAGVPAERKPDGSWVTPADRDAEELLRRLIRQRYSQHGVVGEEHGELRGDGEHRWILDPIDGTQSFVNGVPLFGVLVALEIGGTVEVGVCHLPGLRETVAAATGEGCRWNGRRARVSATSDLERAVVLCTDVLDLARKRPDVWDRLRERVRTHRGWSDCYGYCAVATGRADVMLDPVMKPWDCAALIPILKEAGGSFTDWRGREVIDGGNGLATNGALLEQALALVSD